MSTIDNMLSAPEGRPAAQDKNARLVAQPTIIVPPAAAPAAARPAQPKVEAEAACARDTPFTLALLSGACAGTTVDIALYPLDTLKVRLQYSKGVPMSTSVRGALGDALRDLELPPGTTKAARPQPPKESRLWRAPLVVDFVCIVRQRTLVAPYQAVLLLSFN